MKIIMHGPMAGYGPHGQIESWGPDQEVTVDDGDKKAVEWARGWVGMGATLLEDVKQKEAKAPPAAPHRSARL